MVRLYSVICKLCTYSIVKCKLQNTSGAVWAYKGKIVKYI